MSLTKATYSMIEGAPINVLDYGAVGDGVANDTAAIQAAITYAEGLTKPGAVYLPRGTYKITSPLTITKGIQFAGDGIESTSIRVSTSITVISVALSGGAVGCMIADMTLQNVQTAGTATAGAGIRLQNSSYCVISNVRTTNCYDGVWSTNSNFGRFLGLVVNGFVGAGIRLDSGFDSRFYDFTISGNSIGSSAIRITGFNDEHMFIGGVCSSSTYALNVDSAAYAVSQRPEFCKFINVSFDSCLTGLVLDRCTDMVFEGCFISNRPNEGAIIGGTAITESITFSNCTFFNNGGNGLTIGANARNTRVTGCNFIDNSVTTPSTAHGAVVTDTATNFSFINNVFKNGWGGGGTQNFGLYISGASCNNFVVAYNDCTAATGNTIVNNSTGATQIIQGNMGSSYELNGSAVYDPPNLPNGDGGTTAVTVTGAALGDYVTGVSFSLDLQGITLTAWVSAANTVNVRFQNETGGAIDLASGTLRARVAKK